MALAPAYLVGYRAASASMSSDVDQMAASFDVMIRDVVERRASVPGGLLRNAKAHFYQYLTTQAAATAPPEDVLRRLWLTLRVDPARVGVPHLWRIACMNALAYCFGAFRAGSPKDTAVPRRTLPLDAVAALRPHDLPTLTRLYRAPGQVRWSWRPFDWVERRRWLHTCQSSAAIQSSASIPAAHAAPTETPSFASMQTGEGEVHPPKPSIQN